MLPGLEVQAHVAAMGSALGPAMLQTTPRWGRGRKQLPKTSSHELRVLLGCSDLGSISQSLVRVRQPLLPREMWVCQKQTQAVEILYLGFFPLLWEPTHLQASHQGTGALSQHITWVSRNGFPQLCGHTQVLGWKVFFAVLLTTASEFGLGRREILAPGDGTVKFTCTCASMTYKYL